jgi:hypothetical protein
MKSKYLPLLIFVCTPLVHADLPAGTSISIQDQAKADELDAISADIAVKFNAMAPAAAFDPLLARIGKLQLASIRGMSQDPMAVRAYGLQQFIAGWQDYLLQKDKAPESANNSLQQLVALSATITVIPRTTLLGMAIKPEDMQAARLKKANDFMTALTDKVVATIDAAKSPSDLDPLFAEISQAANNRNDYGSNNNRVQNLKYFVQNWQDYLAAIKDGRITDARTDLHGLENPNYDASFYPRSKILAAINSLPPAPPPRMLSLAKPEQVTLDNLDSFLAQIMALRDNAAFKAEGENGLEQAVVNLKQAYTDVKAGRGKDVLSNPMINANAFGGLGRYNDAIAQLWLQVKLQAAPDAIDAPATMAKPTDKDTFASYLEHSLVAAIASKDWALATRILRTEQVTTPADAAEDLVGIHALIIGGNHEAADQWAEAVGSYTSALNSTGRHLPIKELSARLLAIQKAHPDEYAAGLKLPDPTLQRKRPIFTSTCWN